jgi:zinc protease
MPSRMERGYYITDLITDILGGGASSRLYQSLVKEKKLFSSLDCYHFGSIDNGLLTIEGKLVKGVDIKLAEQAVNEEVEKMKTQLVDINELQKVINKTESTMLFEDMGVMSRANSLAFYELLGDAGLMNTELGVYQSITANELMEQSKTIFEETNSNTLYYLSKN